MDKILVLGASGGLGSRVVKQAVEKGHGVIALVRSKDKLKAAIGEDILAQINVVEGSAADSATLDSVLKEMKGGVAVDTLGNDGRLELLTQIAKQCSDADVELMAMGGAGILKLPHNGEYLWTVLGFLGDWVKPVSEMHIAVGDACRSTPGLRWLQMAPPGMSGGERTGSVEGIADSPPPEEKQVQMASYEDVADVILAHVPPSKSPYAGQAVGLAKK